LRGKSIHFKIALLDAAITRAVLNIAKSEDWTGNARSVPVHRALPHDVERYADHINGVLDINGLGYVQLATHRI